MDEIGEFLPMTSSPIGSAAQKGLKLYRFSAQELCLNEPEAKGWSLRYFDNQKCSCFKTITDSKRDPTFKSGKFCQCDLKYHPSILHSNR